MNVIFLTLVEIQSVEDRGIYQDLLRKFRDEGHSVTIVTPVERRKRLPTKFENKDGVSIIQVKTLNIQKTNIVEKGLGTLAIEYQYLSAIKKFSKDTKFDLILYSTPPITLVKVIKYIKNRDNASTYLLLKDIFPQNAIDMKMLKKGGFIHKQFLKKEKQLYEISDTIGCMSPANVDFVLKHNPEINKDKIEINPNSIEPITFNYSEEEKKEIREKYQIPIDKKVFVYGGNLGKPQGLDFLLETISTTKNSNAFFLIIGKGTEYSKIENWFIQKKPLNAKLIKSLPKDDYDKLLPACDLGLIFLHKNFQIPNFPSRLLSYLEMNLPIIAATDKNTDIGDIIEKNGCGFKVISGNQNQMQEKLNLILESDLKIFAKNGKRLLYDKYTVSITYDLILNRLKNV